MSEIYDDVNLADLAEEFDRLEKGGSNNNILEKFVRMPVKEGSVTVRLLPPAREKKFYCGTRIHKLTYSNGSVKNVHCTRVLQKINGNLRWVDKDYKDQCPICKYYNSLWKEIDKLSKDQSEENKKQIEDIKNQARLVKPMERYYYNCVVRQQLNPKTEEIEKNVGPKILSIGKMVHQKIVRAIVGDPVAEEPALGDVSNPKNGRDLKIIKKIKGGFPDYGESKFLDQSPSGDKDQMKVWFENLNDLQSLRRLISHEEMSVLLGKYLGTIPLDDNDDPTSFNTSNFEDNHDDEDHQIPQKKVENKKPAVVAQAEQYLGGSGNEDDEFLTDDEFFKELK